MNEDTRRHHAEVRYNLVRSPHFHLMPGMLDVSGDVITRVRSEAEVGGGPLQEVAVLSSMVDPTQHTRVVRGEDNFLIDLEHRTNLGPLLVLARAAHKSPWLHLRPAEDANVGDPVCGPWVVFAWDRPLYRPAFPGFWYGEEVIALAECILGAP